MISNVQSGNQLSGTLPSGPEMPSLAALDLSHNQLTGTLSRAYWPMLQLLALGNNRFTGQIPAPTGANQLGSQRTFCAHNTVAECMHALLVCRYCLVGLSSLIQFAMLQQ